MITSNILKQFEAKTLSWNPSGTQLAIGYCYGPRPHSGWCRHQAIPMTAWSLSRNLLKKGPFHEIPFDSCTTTVKFHPALGSFMAVGFYSGEIALVDFNGVDKEPQVEDISKFLKRDDPSAGAAAGWIFNS